jgi:hypothetical protein
MRIICDYCNRPINGKKEKVGNANVHSDCLEEIAEITEPMFREKLEGNYGRTDGQEQNHPSRTGAH